MMRRFVVALLLLLLDGCAMPLTVQQLDPLAAYLRLERSALADSPADIGPPAAQ